jgi:hypothetical protein
MKARWIYSGLLAGAVMLGAGTAFSGGDVTTNNMLVDYNEQTGELWAYPKGLPMAVYLNTPATQHGLADLSRFTPPDPCRGFAHAWNAQVAWEIRHGVVGDTAPRHSFSVLLGLMTEFQCTADLTTATGSPQLLVITPTAK